MHRICGGNSRDTVGASVVSRRSRIGAQASPGLSRRLRHATAPLLPISSAAPGPSQSDRQEAGSNGWRCLRKCRIQQSESLRGLLQRRVWRIPLNDPPTQRARRHAADTTLLLSFLDQKDTFGKLRAAARHRSCDRVISAGAVHRVARKRVVRAAMPASETGQITSRSLAADNIWSVTTLTRLRARPRR